MERTTELKFTLILGISVFIHLISGIIMIMPDYNAIIKHKKAAKGLFDESGRDIIVNVNEDLQKDYKKTTLMSEKDSAAKGFLNKKKGDRWLNNSLDFFVKRGMQSQGKLSNMSSKQLSNHELLIAENTQLVIALMKEDYGSILGQAGNRDFTRVPDKYGITRENAIFYSNDGRFSFNTKKFKNFKYFKSMKDKIASNWYPPLLANAVIQGYDPITGAYTPGRTRIMAIPNQEVKLYFTMARSGQVRDIVIVDSQGNRTLDTSCIDSIRMSKNFGKVPNDIPGEIIVIRFIFGYYVY